MFIKNNDNGLVFVKSNNIKVFPCGRRSSNLVDSVADGDKQYIPFDPEARLYTESNNRKHSGLNGFTQDYLLTAWEDNKLSFVIAGYLFDIDTTDLFSTANTFGNEISSLLGNTSSNSIYANIKLAKINLLSGNSNSKLSPVGTYILRDQTLQGIPSNCLDVTLFDPDNGYSGKITAEDYYFSGLSFSCSKLAKTEEEPDGTEIISLLVLSRDDLLSAWHSHEPSKLPKIAHGKTEDSVEIKDLTITGTLSIIDKDTDAAVQVPILKVEQTSTKPERYRLNFSYTG